jgi:adenylosuccinate synthase
MDSLSSEAFRGTGEKIDDEFGARTGRARRLGWLDLVIVKYAVTVNGYTDLAVCKIDKLDELAEIQICVGYKLDGKEITHMPSTRELYGVKPVYVKLKGWGKRTSGIRTFEQLPKNAKAYLEFIEKYTGVRVTYVGVGPDRDNTIVR